MTSCTTELDEAARLSKEWYAARDLDIAQAHAEGKRLAQGAISGINNKVGFWIRSEGQIRRYEKARKK